MSDQYIDYLREHIGNVAKAIHWMIDHQIIPEGIPGSKNDMIFMAMSHDNSKYSREEFNAYDDYFYGKKGRDEDDIEVIDSTFDYAWLHHIHWNPHHWQHWVLLEDEGKIKPLEMPVEFVYEMIADWWSFSFKKGNLYEIFDWYEEHKNRIHLHEKTRKLVEETLLLIRKGLDEEKAQKEET